MNPLRAAVFILIGLLTNTIALSDAIDPNVEYLKKPLNLSEQQTQELSKAYKEAREKLLSLRKEMIEVNKTKKAKIDAVLKPEQKKKYDELNTPSFPKESEAPEMMPMGAEPESAPAEQPPAK